MVRNRFFRVAAPICPNSYVINDLANSIKVE
jgi:hypothetical protein